MKLNEILAGPAKAGIVGNGDVDILGLTADSREVQDGFLFVAVPGCGGDGMRYIGDAVDRGAAALLVSRVPPRDPGVPYAVVEDARLALGEAAAAFYGHPSRSLGLVGVTGTNGKTTTAYLLRHIFNEAGMRAGMLGTVEYDLGDKLEPSPLTTPDPVRFTRSLAGMLGSGCKTAVVEVSSHALSQHRVWPHRFDAAVFTNLTRDHLDYHGDMERYLEAKRILFTRLDAAAAAVFNYRDPSARRMAEGVVARRYGYVLAGEGAEPEDVPADALRGEIVASGLEGQRFRARGRDMDMEFRTPLVGRYNVENCLGAFLAAVAMGVHPLVVARALEDFPGVPGRLERIVADDGRVAFVDYSHTDDALRSTLSVLRPLVAGKLITVFGCGGDRDPGKRPMMARAAEEYSDVVVLTSDNPRTEDPDRIIADIMPGFARPERVEVEADRVQAVRLAAGLAAPGDALLVAGKGHENYQIVGTEKHHMDDRELVRDAFRLVVPGAGEKGSGR